MTTDRQMREPTMTWEPTVGEDAFVERCGRGRVVGITGDMVHIRVGGQRHAVSLRSPRLHPPTWRPAPRPKTVRPATAPAPTPAPIRPVRKRTRRRKRRVVTGLPVALVADLRAAGFAVGRTQAGHLVRATERSRPIVVLAESPLSGRLEPMTLGEATDGRRHWPSGVPDPYLTLREAFRKWETADDAAGRVRCLRQARREVLELLGKLRAHPRSRWYQVVNGGLGQ